jgi:hypoxanthine-DNA glycosylase
MNDPMPNPLLESLPPAVPDTARVLLLGSMPGAASLAAQQYYAHPRNNFWPFMSELFGVDSSQPYAERLRQLNAAGVGVWDVLQNCERPGSLDSSILRSTEVPNDVATLLQHRPQITMVGCNGAKAFQLFQRYVTPQLEKGSSETLARIKVLQLPSTSPANQSIPRQVKLDRWGALTRPAR